MLQISDCFCLARYFSLPIILLQVNLGFIYKKRISFIRKIIALLDVFWHQWFANPLFLRFCISDSDTSIYFRAFMTWQEAEKLFFLGKERILQSSAVITFCSLSGLLVLLSWPVSSLSQAIYHIVDLATFLQSL